MNKECPHCHVDDFRVKDLLILDYFHSLPCPNCGKPVRNSGLSQFLAPFIMLILFIAMLPLSNWLPGWLFFSLLMLLAPLPFLIFAKPTKAGQLKPNLPPFTRDRHNDKSIHVCGWKEPEVRKIIEDFLAEDGYDPPPKITLHKQYDDEFSLTFPEDIAPSDFAALVNYLNYPIDFGLAGRSIAVVGKMTLTTDWAGIPKDLIGKKASLYVPDNDEDYTVVFMHTDAGKNFFSSFNDSAWQPVSEDRLPPVPRSFIG